MVDCNAANYARRRIAYDFGCRNLAPVEGGERVLRTSYLPPFEKACIDAGALAIMTAYSILDGVPAVSNARKCLFYASLTWIQVFESICRPLERNCMFFSFLLSLCFLTYPFLVSSEKSSGSHIGSHATQARSTCSSLNTKRAIHASALLVKHSSTACRERWAVAPTRT